MEQWQPQLSAFTVKNNENHRKGVDMEGPETQVASYGRLE